eukprot:jgi/Ulvmu1/9106/UM005_0201.1
MLLAPTAGAQHGMHVTNTALPMWNRRRCACFHCMPIAQHYARMAVPHCGAPGQSTCLRHAVQWQLFRKADCMRRQRQEATCIRGRCRPHAMCHWHSVVTRRRPICVAVAADTRAQLLAPAYARRGGCGEDLLRSWPDVLWPQVDQLDLPHSGWPMDCLAVKHVLDIRHRRQECSLLCSCCGQAAQTACAPCRGGGGAGVEARQPCLSVADGALEASGEFQAGAATGARVDEDQQWRGGALRRHHLEQAFHDLVWHPAWPPQNPLHGAAGAGAGTGGVKRDKLICDRFHTMAHFQMRDSRSNYVG